VNISVRSITLMAILIALNIILSRVCSVHIPFEGVESIRIGFGTLPLVLGGILLGARLGFFAGIIGDLAGFVLAPMGMFLPTFTIAAGLHGLLSGIIAGSGKTKDYPRWRVYLAITMSQILVTIIVIPGLLQWHFGIPFWVTLPARLVTQAILIPMYCALIYAVLAKVKICYREQSVG
jgi:ECF transporter S component (folate family)